MGFIGGFSIDAEFRASEFQKKFPGRGEPRVWEKFNDDILKFLMLVRTVRSLPFRDRSPVNVCPKPLCALYLFAVTDESGV